MKTTRIAVFIIAAAGSLSGFAQDSTSSCVKGVASDVRLVAIADKVGLDSREGSSSRALERVANEDERAALAVWQGLRRQCFDAGESRRHKMLDAQAHSAIRSAFLFQQVLLSRLQQGELTYGEFNRRRAVIAESFEPSN